MYKIANQSHSILVIFTLFLFAEISWSQTALSEMSIESSSRSPKKTNTSTRLTFRQYKRLSPTLHPQSTPYLLETLFKGQGHFLSSFNYKYDIKAQYVPKNSRLFYSFSELHLTRFYPKTTWSFGRKILPWNRSEAFWGVNELNGQDGLSGVNPKQEGLIGLHLKQKMGSFTGELFASYLFLPRLNPGSHVKDGYVYSGNEWGLVSPTALRIQDGVSPIHYNLDKPNAKEVFDDFVFQRSLGISLTYQYQAGSVAGKFRTYGIYKPENDIRIYSENFYDQTSEVAHVSTTLSAFTAHHTLVGAEAYHQVGPLSWNIHISHNRPYPKRHKQQSPDANFIELYDQSYYETTTLFNSLVYRYRHWHAGFHYLNIRQNDFYQQQDQITTLSKIPIWHKAVGFSLAYQKSYSWNGLFDLKHDYHLDNTILKGQLAYQFPRGWLLGVQAEIVQSPRLQKINHWNKYRTNDTLQTYLTYIF